MQNYFYDLHDQLIKAEIFKKDGTKESWHYVYDALGRRIAKTQTEVSDRHIEFLWDGSHLLQEVYANGWYTYVYTDTDSYEPLAQIHNYTNEEHETYQEINYFHCDQIGIPREVTDSDGKLLWFGDYYGWGKLKSETNITNAHQPFRLQNQYCDAETGLHYNFSRYYEPNAGRFINQDPIKLSGGSNFYQFAINSWIWIDPLGLARKPKKSRLPEGSRYKDFGPPNGCLGKGNPDTGVLQQIRTYDSNGDPVLDIDFGHTDGVADPHAHDWYRPGQSPNKVRGSGRPIKTSEPPSEPTYEEKLIAKCQELTQPDVFKC